MDDFKYLLKFLDFKKNYILESDEDTGKKLEIQITERDKYYTRLLKDYICITKARNYTKEIHKWLFFWLIVVAAVLVIIYAYKILNRVLIFESDELIVKSFPVIIAAIVSFVSTIIGIPMTITKFLFNTKEDDNITSLIQHTQEHDSSGINMLKGRFGERAKNNKTNRDTELELLKHIISSDETSAS